MKTILVLVQSSNQSPYDAMLEKQKNTWNLISIDGVSTIFYYGSLDIENNTLNDDVLILKTSDINYNRTFKLKLALDFIWNMKWDYVIRTNSSSYIDKKRLLNKIQALPENKCFFGKTVADCISGIGMIFSRDVVDILRKNIDSSLENNSDHDDVMVAHILKSNGIPIIGDGSLVFYNHDCNFTDFINSISLTDTDPYCYRCRPNCAIDQNRHKDLEAFENLFNFLKNT